MLITKFVSKIIFITFASYSPFKRQKLFIADSERFQLTVKLINFSLKFSLVIGKPIMSPIEMVDLFYFCHSISLGTDPP